jgi:endonuclease
MVRILLNPTHNDLFNFVNKYHCKKPEKTYLQLMGICKVYYHGRARSFLDWGDRIIMIKQDGNILVHQSMMREPINWQPAGSITDYKKNDNHFIVSSRHKNPNEKMKILFKQVSLAIITQLIDNAQLKIHGMEIDVVNHIVSNPSCVEEGLRIKKREKQVKSGLIDLFCYDKNHIPVVIEVKRSLATISAVHQLRMYVKDIKKGCSDSKVRGILCAPRVPDMVKHLLDDYKLEWMEVDHEIVLADEYQKKLFDFSENI